MRWADFRPGDPSAQRIRIGIHLDRQGNEHDAIVELLRASRQWGCTLLSYLGTPTVEVAVPTPMRAARRGPGRVSGRLPHPVLQRTPLIGTIVAFREHPRIVESG